MTYCEKRLHATSILWKVCSETDGSKYKAQIKSDLPTAGVTHNKILALQYNALSDDPKQYYIDVSGKDKVGMAAYAPTVSTSGEVNKSKQKRGKSLYSSDSAVTEKVKAGNPVDVA